jgi:creatinine amidohydrolase
MRLQIFALVPVLAFSISPSARQTQIPAPAAKGQRLEALTWREAEPVLTPETIVVLPLGAASKEHGPHLKLRNDLTLADYLTQRVVDSTAVVVAPTLTYHFYPAFLEYPGSTSLSLATARDMTADVVRTLSAYGPRRFYVLNTGVSTIRALEPAAALLAADGVLMRYTNLGARLEPASQGYREQDGGTHADEIETSMMLYIDPSSVDMTKAVKDYTPSTGGARLTRQRGGTGTYSPTGIWGDPTRATRAKGQIFVEALVAGILEDITSLRSAPLPTRSNTQPPTAEPPRVEPTPSAAAPAPNTPERCSAGDERAVLALGSAFATHWANGDYAQLGAMWSRGGDLIHPDGVIERGAQVITVNRAMLFRRREYRSTRHPLVLNMARCLSNDIAIADGKWELRGVLDSSGKPLPMMEGQVTLVLKRTSGWLIEAYRYTLTPSASTQTTPTTLPKRPGGPEPALQ